MSAPDYNAIKQAVLDECEAMEYGGEWQGSVETLARWTKATVPTLLVALQQLANEGVIMYATTNKATQVHIDVLEGN